MQLESRQNCELRLLQDLLVDLLGPFGYTVPGVELLDCLMHFRRLDVLVFADSEL